MYTNCENHNKKQPTKFYMAVFLVRLHHFSVDDYIFKLINLSAN